MALPSHRDGSRGDGTAFGAMTLPAGWRYTTASSGMTYSPTRLASCLSQSLSLVCKRLTQLVTSVPGHAVPGQMPHPDEAEPSVRRRPSRHYVPPLSVMLCLITG